MKRLTIGSEAPDFELPDHNGIIYRLSDIFPKKNVLLVFNIGFV